MTNLELQKMTVSPLEEAKNYVNPEKEVATPEEALNGAKDILAEGISDNADFRTHIRELTMKHGQLLSAAKDPDAESVYEMYYDFNEGLSKLAGHRILAISQFTLSFHSYILNRPPIGYDGCEILRCFISSSVKSCMLIVLDCIIFT